MGVLWPRLTKNFSILWPGRKKNVKYRVWPGRNKTYFYHTIRSETSNSPAKVFTKSAGLPANWRPLRFFTPRPNTARKFLSCRWDKGYDRWVIAVDGSGMKTKVIRVFSLANIPRTFFFGYTISCYIMCFFLLHNILLYNVFLCMAFKFFKVLDCLLCVLPCCGYSGFDHKYFDKSCSPGIGYQWFQTTSLIGVTFSTGGNTTTSSSSGTLRASLPVRM